MSFWDFLNPALNDHEDVWKKQLVTAIKVSLKCNFFFFGGGAHPPSDVEQF